MKMVYRLLAVGSLAFVMAGVSLITTPVAYSAEKKVAVEERKEQGYVASKEGEKYHSLSCRLAKNIKTENKVSYKSKAEAEKDGKAPCGVCKP